MKRVLIVMSLFFIASSIASYGAGFLDTKADTQKLCDEFMQKIIGGEIESAFDLIEPYFPIPQNELYNMKMQTIKQLGMAEQRFGKAIGYEFVKKQEVTQTIVKYIYVEKFDNTPVRWVFIFYKPTDEWMLNAFTWDDNVEMLFQ